MASRGRCALEHAPKVEVKEHVKSYTIAVELPGLDQKDVKVLVEDDTVTISGEKHVERNDEKTHYSERSYGSFARAFTLPSDADRDGIEANFARGVLTLEIPSRPTATTAPRKSRSRYPSRGPQNWIGPATIAPTQAPTTSSTRPGMT